MPVFISYSHQDKDFVNQFAAHLMQHRTWIWVDRWELSVGDSIVQKVQEAIKDASALIVVLSKASVNSEWCKKELSAGLVRELDEKRVIVLPALIEDCEIPIFLRDKMYANFRSNYDDGLTQTLEAIAKVTSDKQGRSENIKAQHTDWGMDWIHSGGNSALRLTIVDHGENFPYCVLTEIRIGMNATASARYKQYVDAGLDWLGRSFIINVVAETVKGDTRSNLLIEDSFPATANIGIRDTKTDLELDVRVVCRRMGEDIGKDTYVRWGQQLEQMQNSLRKNTRPPTSAETQRLIQILRTPIGQALSFQAIATRRMRKRKRRG